MKSSQTSSIRPERPLARVCIPLALATFAAAALSLMLGPVSLSPGEVISAFFKSEAVTSADRIALYARLPRTCGCIVAGAALAVSGAVIQSVLSNPLAAPNVIGVNSGAGLAAAICCAFFPGAYAAVPFAAFLGALLSVLLVLLIAERTGASKITLVLGGVAISSVLSAGVDAVVTFVPDALVGYSDFRIGSLSGLTMQKLAPAAWVVLAALALAFSLTHELDLLMLGRDHAPEPRPEGREDARPPAGSRGGARGRGGEFCGAFGLCRPHRAAHHAQACRRREPSAPARLRHGRGGHAAHMRPRVADAVSALRAARGHSALLHRRAVFRLAAAKAEKGAQA